MTVFRCYMKIVKKNIGLLLLYLGIFLGITIIFQGTANQTGAQGYQTTGLKIGVVDDDHGKMAESLTDYMGQYHDMIPMRTGYQQGQARK